jgi:hypothetical protein
MASESALILCSSAAVAGEVDLLKWAHANEFYWDADTFTEAAGFGDVTVLEWLRVNGCPEDVVAARAAAKSRGHDVVHAWLSREPAG